MQRNRVVCAGGKALFVVLALLAAPASADTEKSTLLRILHVNDLHGWLLPVSDPEEGEPPGGFGALAAAVKAFDSGRSLFVAAGDLMSGTNISNLFQGRPVVESLNAMGLQATAAGNHEFDFGTAELSQRVTEASFPFLAANVGGAQATGLQESTFVDAGQLKIGIFGLVTAETPTLTHPRNVEGLSFSDPVAAARETVASLEGAADIIICLSHLGLGADISLAEQVPAIDIIVGGHSHTRLVEPLQVGDTVIVQAYERGLFLGVLDVSVRGGAVTEFSGRLEAVDERFGVDRDVAAIVESYRRRAGRRLDAVVGTAEVRFEGGRELVRTGEASLGSLLADIVMDVSGADGVIVNGGSIRASIPAGPVTLAHLYNAFPFDNYILSFELKGREVRQALESGLSRLEERGGGFPHVAGLSYSFDPRRRAGHRLVDVSIGGAPLVDGNSYIIATNDFLAAGGDGFRVFLEKQPVFVDRGTFVREAVARHWRKRGSMTAAAPGRIVTVE